MNASDLKTCRAFLELFVELRAANGIEQGHEQFLLKHGRQFTKGPHPEDVKKGRAKWCFMNAASLALDRADLIYCEGYAGSIVPMQHAWCCTNEGVVIDPTRSWEDCADYFGIPFRSDYLRKAILKAKRYGLIGNWSNGFALETQHKPEEWRHPGI